MTDAQRIKSAAAAQGLKLREVAAKVGAHPAAFSAAMRRPDLYPKAGQYLAKAKALLGVADIAPIPYDKAAFAADSTGITLPHELLEFLRNKARVVRASNPQASMSRLFVEAMEEKYRPELLEYVSGKRKEKLNTR